MPSIIINVCIIISHLHAWVVRIGDIFTGILWCQTSLYLRVYEFTFSAVFFKCFITRGVSTIAINYTLCFVALVYFLLSVWWKKDEYIIMGLYLEMLSLLFGVCYYNKSFNWGTTVCWFDQERRRVILLNIASESASFVCGIAQLKSSLSPGVKDGLDSPYNTLPQWSPQHWSVK